jgi:hypothetical protein
MHQAAPPKKEVRKLVVAVAVAAVAAVNEDCPSSHQLLLAFLRQTNHRP